MSQLNVLFIKEDNIWVAQCLQYDIAAQGQTIADTQRAFEYALAAEVSYLSKKGQSLDAIPAAPKFYWEMYTHAYKVDVPAEPSPRLPKDIGALLDTLVPVYRESRLAG